AGMISPHICIFINGVAFIISALILLSIVIQKKMKTDKGNHSLELNKHESLWNSWKDGWGIILNSRILVASFFLCY
ncbi:hypothetical protein, partial [Pseudomonas sp. 2995-1]|uniref:hypothetical protein n=1 Tax=Pseudomonas sp. 2995-1 TaxID=1712679 RepID=UPI001C484082